MNISGKISQCNGRLKASQVGVNLEQHGSRIVLRATLPPKPRSIRKKPYQQRIYVGYPANLNGLRRAEAEARKIGALLATGEFKWEPYISTPGTKPQTCGDLIEKLQADYLSNGGSESTWKGDYLKIYKRLPQDAAIGVDVLEKAIKETTANTKTRARACMAIASLAKFAGLDYNPSNLRGNYTPHKVKQRDIPDDSTIAQLREQILNSAWRWVYGIMACYGLRNHEVFHLDMADFPILRVLDMTKTGSREVWPCFPEWADQWNLSEQILPPVKLDRANDKIGHSVTAYLSPLLPFTPYDLRHAWAIRTSMFGWPVELAARQMGHSVDVHVRTYHRWINREHQQRVYELLVNRSDRPLPPAAN